MGRTKEWPGESFGIFALKWCILVHTRLHFDYAHDQIFFVIRRTRKTIHKNGPGDYISK